MDLADFHARKPWGGVVRDAGADVLGDVAGDVVVDEGGGVCGGFDDFAVGGEAGFDECLEAVADAEDEAVAVFQEVGNGIRNPRVAEDGGDEFRGAVWLVSGGEATRDEKDVGGGDVLGECGDGLLDV